MRLDERDFIKHIKMNLESFCVIFCMFFQPLQTNANNIIYIILWGKSYCMLPLGVSASLTNSVFIFRFFLFHEISVLMIGFVFAQIFRESSNTSGNGDSSITSHKNEVGKNLHYLTCSDKRLREIENWLEHFEISKSVNVKKRKFPLIILTSFFLPLQYLWWRSMWNFWAIIISWKSFMWKPLSFLIFAVMHWLFFY